MYSGNPKGRELVQIQGSDPPPPPPPPHKQYNVYITNRGRFIKLMANRNGTLATKSMFKHNQRICLNYIKNITIWTRKKFRLHSGYFTSCFVEHDGKYYFTSCFVEHDVKYYFTSCFVEHDGKYYFTSCFIEHDGKYYFTSLFCWAWWEILFHFLLCWAWWEILFHFLFCWAWWEILFCSRKFTPHKINTYILN